MKLMVDPASGYLYGFPREVPEEFLDKDGKIKDRIKMKEWLLSFGIPEENLAFVWYFKKEEK